MTDEFGTADLYVEAPHLPRRRPPVPRCSQRGLRDPFCSSQFLFGFCYVTTGSGNTLSLLSAAESATEHKDRQFFAMTLSDSLRGAPPRDLVAFLSLVCR
jgi:hypothetical protein